MDDRILERAERRQQLEANPIINQLLDAEQIVAEQPDVNLTPTQKRLKLSGAIQALSDIRSKYQTYIQQKTGAMQAGAAAAVVPSTRKTSAAADDDDEATVPAQTEQQLIDAEKIPNDDEGWEDVDDDDEEGDYDETGDFTDAAQTPPAPTTPVVRRPPPTTPIVHEREEEETTPKKEAAADAALQQGPVATAKKPTPKPRKAPAVKQPPPFLDFAESYNFRPTTALKQTDRYKPVSPKKKPPAPRKRTRKEQPK